jgi:hypothetical protein
MFFATLSAIMFAAMVSSFGCTLYSAAFDRDGTALGGVIVTAGFGVLWLGLGLLALATGFDAIQAQVP